MPAIRKPKVKGSGRKAGTPNRNTMELRRIAQPYTKKAVEMLVEIMEKSGNDMVRLRAVQELLDRAHGKPAQAMTITPDPTVPSQAYSIPGWVMEKLSAAERARLLGMTPEQYNERMEELRNAV